MQVLMRPWGAMHFTDAGPADGPVVIYANSLGTDLRLWDALLPHLPKRLRHIRYDKRGHGLSDCDTGFSIEDLAEDAAALAAHLGVQNCVFVGLSVGGLIGQALAHARPDLVRALVISNSAARIGNAQLWADRIAAVERDGMAGLADGIMDRWFAQPFRASSACAPWRNMLRTTPQAGYVAVCRAIAAADCTETTRSLQMPVLVIAGEQDGATPPDLVKATAALIPQARFAVIAGAGHLPCVEAPAEYASTLCTFLGEVGHD